MEDHRRKPRSGSEIRSDPPQGAIKHLLTENLQFIWISDARVNRGERIVLPDLEGRPKRPREDCVRAVADLLRGFFLTAPEGIGKSQRLALALATRCLFLRDLLDSNAEDPTKRAILCLPPLATSGEHAGHKLNDPP